MSGCTVAWDKQRAGGREMSEVKEMKRNKSTHLEANVWQWSVADHADRRTASHAEVDILCDLNEKVANC
jgi:hypothetical protein